MADNKDDSFTMRVGKDFRPKLNELRKAEADLPGYTEMIERLVDRAFYALTAAKVKKR
jgi:hypothetical protein